MIRVVSNDTKLQGGSVFNIPPLRTCPGKSKVCEAVCYATTGRFMFDNIKQAAENNLKYFRDLGNLPKYMEIRSSFDSMLREISFRRSIFRRLFDSQSATHTYLWQPIPDLGGSRSCCHHYSISVNNLMYLYGFPQMRRQEYQIWGYVSRTCP